MANWAALQESLVGLPVAKRAKHGIHFQKSDGSILANFSGKPCHYLDGKLWKPIDTKPVLRKDGWFGCPHSDVIIHPDGTVKVGDYQQKASLISAKSGVIDGDRIARPFSGGVQYLYITENGFRQEIVLEKCPDLKQASALLDTVSGVLPAKYKASALSAKDSTTAELADSVTLADAKALATYLEKAVYPVVIDPDFGGDAGDGYILGDGLDDFATSRSTSTAYDISSKVIIVGQRSNEAVPYMNTHRGYLKFDTSTIESGSTVTQANLKMAASDVLVYYNYDIQIVKYDWSEWNADPTNATKRETAYDGCLAGTADESVWRNTDGMATNTVYTSGNLSNAWVNKTGSTYYGLRSSRDYDNNSFGGYNAMTTSIHSKEANTESYRPVLTVTYTAGGSKHFLSLLGVGK